MGFTIIIIVVGLLGGLLARTIIYEATAQLSTEEKAALTKARNLNPGKVALLSAAVLGGVFVLREQLAILVGYIVVLFAFAFVWEAHLLRKAGVPQAFIKTYMTTIATFIVCIGAAVVLHVVLVT